MISTSNSGTSAAVLSGGWPRVDLTDYTGDPEALARLDVEYARRRRVLPVGFNRQGAIVVATTADQARDILLRDDVQRLTGMPVEVVVADETAILTKIEQVYRAEGRLNKLAANIASEQATPTTAASPAGGVVGDADGPIVQFVDLLIRQAIRDRASDIHVEPAEHDLVVRYRIDGVLHEAHRAPKQIAAGVISRLKIMAEVNIAERRLPQDGRLSVTVDGATYDLRLSTLPTVHGEKVVMRLLDTSRMLLDLPELGFAPRHLEMLEKAAQQPFGMILVTGPTNSGKTTTLYATLRSIATPAINIITVEDPVEYLLPGINQVAVNEKAGLTFETALPAILRQDPDVVLIGEIRDRQVARIAVEASMTGHLVLSTLHTNDAPTALTRLVEMGVEPYLVGSHLDLVVAQRLCRRLCSRCKQPYQPSVEELTAIGAPPEAAGQTLYRPTGCDYCARTGYQGRIALHEMLPVTGTIARLVVERASTDDIRQAALAEGMTPLRVDGWAKVANGHTTIDEVLRVTVEQATRGEVR